MKKKLITLLLTLGVITLIGCGSTAISTVTTTKADDDKFAKISSESSIGSSICVVVDTDTGIEYVIVYSSSGVTITPRLDSSGKPMIETKYIKK